MIRTAHPAPLKDRRQSFALQTLLLSAVSALILFLPFIIIGGGIFTFYGDFNMQQIPFYQMAHDAVRSGDLFWNWTTDLGSNFIGSYSFYLLGSPFFWLTLPFPSALVPYLMGPLLILKFICASMAAYAFLQRFVRGKLAMLGAILYGFSGFSIYNIFFNHFHEAIIVFPLMLYALERFMVDDKRLLFAVTVFFSAFSNYYFFIGQVIFIILYFILRLLSGAWQISWRKFGLLALESVLGTAMACLILCPSFFAVLQNGRVNQYISGFDAIVYDRPQRLADIIHSFFFPQDMPASPNFFPDADNKWASMSAWLPLFSCVGLFGYFQSRRHTDWLKRILLISVLCAVIPLFNSMFQMFNQMYYARWFYMMVLMLVLATVSCFNNDDSEPVDWKRALIWTGCGIAFFSLLIGLMPTVNKNEETVIGLSDKPLMFWGYVAFAVACFIGAVALIRIWKTHRDWFYRSAAIAAAVCAVGYGSYTLVFGKLAAQYSTHYLTDHIINHAEDVTFPASDTFFRFDTNAMPDNMSMFWHHPGVRTFHSIVPGSIMDFYNEIGVTRDVASRPDMTHYALRSLISARYLVDYAGTTEADKFVKNGEPAMFGWRYLETQGDFLLYENDNFIPMGFSYDYYLPSTRFDKLSDSQQELVMLKALVIDEADKKAVSEHLGSLPEQPSYSQADFVGDCAARRQTAVDAFSYDNGGFTASRTADTGNYVFFSVPYESGWSASVNGEPAEILKVNVGFMAVYCPAGENVTIRFDYRTPGLLIGAAVSAAAVTAFAVYAGCYLYFRRRRKEVGIRLLSVYAPITESINGGYHGHDRK